MPYTFSNSSQAINYDHVSLSPDQQSGQSAFVVGSHLVSLMDTVALICLHIGAREMAQAAMWMGGRETVKTPVRCALDAEAYEETIVPKFTRTQTQMHFLFHTYDLFHIWNLNGKES